MTMTNDESEADLARQLRREKALLQRANSKLKFKRRREKEEHEKNETPRRVLTNTALTGEYIPKSQAKHTITIELPTPHEGQRKIYNAGKNVDRNVVRCGRRFGKTLMLVLMACSYAINRFRLPMNQLVAVSGRVGVFTPTYKQGMEIWDELVNYLGPIIEWKNRSERRIFLKTGGRIDMWHIDNNPLAGRGRKYHLALIDEAAFAHGPALLKEIWPLAIRSTLIDYAGKAWVFSTPNGVNEDNFFYAICNNKSMGFLEHHAPTSANPNLKPAEIARFRASESEKTARQEIDAEFIDWAEGAFFNTHKLLVDTGLKDAFDQPIRIPSNMPTDCDVIFVISDTGMKGGLEHDGHGFVYCAFEKAKQDGGKAKAWILDWDYTQVTAAFFERYLPGVFSRGLELSQICRPRHGFQGILMEEKALGDMIIDKVKHGTIDLGIHNGQEYARIKPLDSKLTAKSKDERAAAMGVYHDNDMVRITKHAYDKRTTFKQQTANHLLKQLNGFFLGDPKAHKRADDLLDCYVYMLSVCFGNYKGF